MSHRKFLILTNPVEYSNNSSLAAIGPKPDNVVQLRVCDAQYLLGNMTPGRYIMLCNTSEVPARSGSFIKLTSKLGVNICTLFVFKPSPKVDIVYMAMYIHVQ